MADENVKQETIDIDTTSTAKKDSRSRLREITEVLRRHKVTKGVTPEKLRLILEDLGPTYVKLGQIMSLHSDILPKAYCDELLKLNTEVRPMPFSMVEEVINHSYRTDWREIFSSMEQTPIGSASIAQVHKAVLKANGQEVIVKVERKGIYDTMARDIRLLHRAVKILPSVPSLRNIVDLDMVLDEMWTVAQQEMDFLKEASNMEEFARLNKDIKYVTTPKLYREYTTAHVLVMEYIDGPSITDVETLKAQGYDLNEIGKKFVNSFIKQVMDDGFFHADPHPGNVKIRDGKIVWLDMGMMGRLTERDRKIMVRGVEGIAMHDISKVTDAVLDLGDFWDKPNRDQLYADLRDFLREYESQGMGSVDLAEAMESLMDIMKNNHISLPHGMTMLTRGLSHVEGVLAIISPDINMMNIAYTRVSEDYFDKLRANWKEELSRNSRKLYRAGINSIEIPSLASEIMREYLRGHSRFNLNLDTTDNLVLVVDRAVRNLVIGLCIAGLLVGSSILCTTQMKPQIFGIPFLGFLGYLIAISAIIFFVGRYEIRKIRRWRREHPRKKKKKKI
ncbi:MAG: lipopolysaccharide core heptose(II) kinase RfaY [Lachnospiraceae bacterium]|nr:lipopolysaccharide core heptose(II) kinase RfaY [Lachnospiraceae bacterium]